MNETKVYHPTLNCPYCGGKVELLDSSVVYGKSYGWVYVCERYPICNSFVGCHGNTSEPLGTLANRELREKRKEAHSILDSLWKGRKYFTRGKAYRVMRELMNLTKSEAHIGVFTVFQCDEMIEKIGGWNDQNR